jgi:hypothetical protein
MRKNLKPGLAKKRLAATAKLSTTYRLLMPDRS